MIDLTGLLDTLATAVVAAPDDPLARQAVAGAVRAVEGLAGADLGCAALDPLVLLHRRLARAHRLALAADPDDARVRAAELPRHIAAVLDPERALLTRAPAPTAAA